jgi:hypothetical protein
MLELRGGTKLLDHSGTKLPPKCRANSAASVPDMNSTSTTLSSLLPVEVSLCAYPRSRNHRRTSSIRATTWAEGILISTVGTDSFHLWCQHLMCALVARRSYLANDHRELFGG